MQTTRFEDLPQQVLRLPQGEIRYRELGDGPPIVFVHGVLVNGLLWAEVASALATTFRVIVPDWPLGSHAVPMAAGADRSPAGLARLIADTLAALDVEDVTLVGNDTGGALCQLVVAHHPERVGRLVLTPCDAYENFLPPMFRPLQVAARIPGAVLLILRALAVRPLQRLPMTLGWLSKRPIPPARLEAFARPGLTDARIRADLAAILAGISKRATLAAAERFGEFDRPVLLAWAPEDRIFPFRHAQRLARDFPAARVERIEDSYTFVSLDQPARTAELIGAFARKPVAA